MSLWRDSRAPVLAALMLAMSLVAMDTTILSTAVPQVVGDLGGFEQIGWVFSIYLLTQTVTIPIYGKLADLHGRKPILLIGITVFLIGSALCAVAWDMGALIAFRAVQGIGAGSIAGTVQTVAGDIYSLEERGRVQGYLSSVWGVSAVLAPALGGLFAQYLSWRWIFLVNIPIGILTLMLIMRSLQEDVVKRRHQIDYLGAALVLASAGLLCLWLLESGNSWAWVSVPSLAVLILALIAGLAVPSVERRAAEPIMPPWLWSQRMIALSCGAMATGGMIVIGLSVFLPNWGQTVLGLSPVAAGFMPATMSIAWPIAAAFTARFYMRIGFRNTALLGAGLTTVSALGFISLGPDVPVWQPAAWSAVTGAGMAFIFGPLVIGLQNTVGWGRRGTLTGSLTYSRALGQSVGAAAFGAIANIVINQHQGRAEAVAMHASTHAVFIGVLVVSLTTMALLFLVPSKFPIYRPGERVVENETPAYDSA